jgi:hypothetical protein
MKNFDPFDLANEISVYFRSWQECELADDATLNKRQLARLVKLIQQHEQAQQIYNDFELWFSHNSLREDVMSDTFTDILDSAFEEMFEEAA